MRDLKGAVVVITGASSGIGRAAAQAFAAEGANLVLAARRESVLDEAVAECGRLSRPHGARAIAVPADVTDAGAVRRLAEAAVREFGHVDVWINNAGVGAVGGFAEVPADAHDQVVRTNLLGHMHGAHAILPHFQARRRGVLINTSSLGAWVPTPYAASYSASKFGLRGFSEALRGELSRWPGIHVCDVFPSFVDTPGLRHGGNYVGRELSAPPPVHSPFDVAEAMVSLARNPRPSATVGKEVHLLRLVHALVPGLLRRSMARLMERRFRRARPVPVSDGNLFAAPTRSGGIHGSAIYGGLRQPSSGHALRTGLMLGGALLLGGWLLRRARG
ncbi:SDR family oxidoreductase [Roseomonas gilardii]|uniref:SDR family oxidoreductase n=1 Tax=Roseomonas gilardii TaxID=257708 RepID=UPI0011A1014C|nr:SDR family oxidoreductase [Roseomonas gilardii]